MLEPGHYQIDRSPDTLEVFEDGTIRRERWGTQLAGIYPLDYGDQFLANLGPVTRLPDRLVPKFKTPDGSKVGMVPYLRNGEDLAYQAFGFSQVVSFNPAYGSYFIRDHFGLRNLDPAPGRRHFKYVNENPTKELVELYAQYLSPDRVEEALLLSDTTVRKYYPKEGI